MPTMVEIDEKDQIMRKKVKTDKNQKNNQCLDFLKKNMENVEIFGK
jgi:hypothetical protein